MEWSNQEILKLIDVYRRKTFLWNPQTAEHFRKPNKAKAWQEIGSEMDAPAEECKKKMISLLSSYRRERSRMRKSREKGKGRGSFYVSKWFAFDAFKFLKDRASTKKGAATDTDEELDDQDQTDDSNPPEKTQTTAASSSSRRSSKRAKVADDIDSSVMSTTVEIPKNTVEKSKSNKESGPNEIDAFFTYVVAKVNKYSPETQTSIQHAIFEVLMKADNGYFDGNPPGYQNTNNWQTSQNVAVQSVKTSPIRTPVDSTPIDSSEHVSNSSPTESITEEKC